MAGDGKQVRILDIGCGNGEISLQFLPMASHITLLDNSPEMLDLCRANVPAGDTAKVNYVCSDFHVFEPDILFDLVLCIGVLAHVESVESTFTKLSSFLAPSGVCLVQLTDAGTLLGWGIYLYENWLHRKQAGYALNCLSAGDVMKIAGRHGLYLQRKQAYWTVLSGFGWLPESWIWRFQESALRNSWLARWGTEVFLLFQKNDERK
jgi:2-polyprenyl-3-methyl-5-hydroxy-6-metoxy-1,4-benzoquinol methylase